MNTEYNDDVLRGYGDPNDTTPVNERLLDCLVNDVGHSLQQPSHQQIKTFRLDMMVSKNEAAKMVSISVLKWYLYELGILKMHPSMWELFILKTDPRFYASQTLYDCE